MSLEDINNNIKLYVDPVMDEVIFMRQLKFLRIPKIEWKVNENDKIFEDIIYGIGDLIKDKYSIIIYTNIFINDLETYISLYPYYDERTKNFNLYLKITKVHVRKNSNCKIDFNAFDTLDITNGLPLEKLLSMLSNVKRYECLTCGTIQ